MDELIESAFEIFVFDKATSKQLNRFVVIAYSEMEAFKKTGIIYDSKTQRIFIRLAGHEWQPDMIASGVKLYPDTAKDINAVDIVAKLATK
jgi:hypothetical protein